MPSGWICRSRTDGVVPEEPPIMLEYYQVPGDVALKDVARFLAAAAPGTIIRIATWSPVVHETLHAWSNENRVIIPYEDKVQFTTGAGYVCQYTLDLQSA